MSPHEILRIRGLSKTFTDHLRGGRRRTILDAVDLELEHGELVALVGPSGSGKSSLLRCIYRTYLPSSGEILLDVGDRSVDLAAADEVTVLEVRRRELALMMQFLRPPPRVASLRLVTEAAVAAGTAHDRADELARALLDQLAIPRELWASYPAVMSGGERQRVNLAAVLARRSRLLLLDEPTSALDRSTRRRSIAAIAEYQAAGGTVLAVVHGEETLERLATSVLELHRGRTRRARSRGDRG
jgi:alpha-D-ribose 1-methylphosphonate 5-triphosphate synthase subunit PhnL